MRIQRALLALLFASSGLLLTVARADTVSVSDPQGDNAGQNGSGDQVAGRLDFARVAHEHLVYGDGHELLVHRAETYDEWSNDVLSGQIPDVILAFSFRHSAGQARVSIGVNEDGTLYGAVSSYNTRTGEEEIRGFARVWRPDTRSVAVALTRDQLWPDGGTRLTEYEWVANSTDRECPNYTSDYELYCSDRAPDSGGLRHVIEGPGSLDCRDGVDNDRDGLVDYPEDSGCTSADDYFEGLTEEDCADPCVRPILTIAKRGTFPQLRGRLQSPQEACMEDRYVYLYRSRPGPDRWVMRIGLDNGRWGMEKPSLRGRYYALVRAETTGWFSEMVKCSRVASRRISVG